MNVPIYQACEHYDIAFPQYSRQIPQYLGIAIRFPLGGNCRFSLRLKIEHDYEASIDVEAAHHMAIIHHGVLNGPWQLNRCDPSSKRVS